MHASKACAQESGHGPDQGARRRQQARPDPDAAQQLFAQGGFDGVSMRDIAAQAGVGLP